MESKGLGTLTKKTFVTCVIVAMMLSMTLMSGVMGMTQDPVTGSMAGPRAILEATGAPVGFIENLGQFPDGDVMFYQGLSYGGVAFRRRFPTTDGKGPRCQGRPDGTHLPAGP